MEKKNRENVNTNEYRGKWSSFQAQNNLLDLILGLILWSEYTCNSRQP